MHVFVDPLKSTAGSIFTRLRVLVAYCICALLSVVESYLSHASRIASTLTCQLTIVTMRRVSIFPRLAFMMAGLLLAVAQDDESVS
jgi:hypothetical protein